jgi:hypothetical protein
MASQLREVPYGRASAANAGPSVRVVPGVKLRLCDGPYPFDEPPDLVRLATVEERMGLLCDHLKSLCGPWDKLAKNFLDAYFAAVAGEIAAAAAELRSVSGRSGGLFAPPDWSFCALRPLPQAHLPAEGDARAALAFWTGDRFAAIAVEGSASADREERARRARIEAAGVEIVRVPASVLPRLTLAQLPQAFRRFWDGVTLPSSPFGPAALDEF